MGTPACGYFQSLVYTVTLGAPWWEQSHHLKVLFSAQLKVSELSKKLMMQEFI